jgi:hypothetical protein
MASGEKAHEQSVDEFLLTHQNFADFAADLIDQDMLLFYLVPEFLHGRIFLSQNVCVCGQIIIGSPRQGREMQAWWMSLPPMQRR